MTRTTFDLERLTPPVKKLLSITALAAATALVLSGCASASTDAGATDDPSNSSGVRVVASTDVYGDIAKQIGGDRVSVTSIIDDPDKDPHEYEADARTQLSLSKAQLVIENGAGYDDFVEKMLSAADNKVAPVLNAADISGYNQKPAEGDFNEHVWYDFPTVQKLTDELVKQLSAIDPEGAKSYEANAKTFEGQLTALEQQEKDIKTSFDGAGAAITEPVPLYMLTAAGLVNKTPAAFSEAIEEGTDVPADVLKQTTDQFSSGAVKVLVYNEQTSGAQTELVLTAAKDAKVPVVPVTETLPAGSDYISWMTTNLNALQGALSGK
ncbi:metal ABC transporter solute-binding protein, Zn/Mn family [Agreia pratensis]|uniref:Zinc/manganese transport system substrate-binding protein n=1 Tax=Agreia pratensis TaxID=150121 RepID=A0A1X7KQG1_9MICO|nr:zinc ABC transporter substrate-binding protein [Agreia pratensis]SMG43843.1 zinc/manganese transport system substrate-binding protein [Agreia pratensis]